MSRCETCFSRQHATADCRAREQRLVIIPTRQLRELAAATGRVTQDGPLPAALGAVDAADDLLDAACRQMGGEP